MAIEKALRWVTLVAVFCVPFLALYVANSMFFPFISGKNFAFRILVEIAASAWLALALINPTYRPKRTWLLWVFGALVVIMAVADALGVYPHKSFWSNYERMDGWITLAHLFAYFVVTVSVLNTEKLWRAWWYTTLGVSTIVGLIGVFQLFGWVPINQGGVRLDARLGNATYAGVYMLFHIAIATLLLARVWVNEPHNRVVAAWFLGLLITLDTIILFYTETRGAILGLAGATVVAGLISACLTRDRRVRRVAAASVVMFVVLSGAVWAARDTSLVHAISPLHRVATSFEDTSNNARLMNWAMAWQGFQERPLLGWGHENYAAVFDKYYDPNMWGQEPWFDRTHNIIFDWLIAGGIFGLLAYLSLYVFALFALWRSGVFAPYERAILTGLFAGYFFYLLFTFDNITSYILFVSVLAYIIVRASADRPPLMSAVSLPKGAVAITAGTMAILGILLVWLINADAIRQNRTLIQAMRSHAEGVTENLALFKEAALYESVGTQEVREQFSQAAIHVLGAEEVPLEVKEEFVQAAATEFRKQVEDAPLNARAPFFLGALLDRAGAYNEAKVFLETAYARSSRKQAILFELGMNAFARNAPSEAVAFFREAFEHAPEFKEARTYYAVALIRTSNDFEAGVILQPLVEVGAAADRRIASAYAARGLYEKIIEIWRVHVEKNPQDVDARFLLAGALYAAGDSAAAIRELEATKEAIPSATVGADELIRQIHAGVPVE